MRKRISKILWTYGPTFQWRSFRLHGEPPSDRWKPIRITQIVGGKSWSLSLTRTGPLRSPQCEICGAESTVRRTNDPDPRVPQIVCVDAAACMTRVMADEDELVTRPKSKNPVCDGCGHWADAHGDEGCDAQLEMSNSARPCPCLLTSWQFGGTTAPQSEPSGGGF